MKISLLFTLFCLLAFLANGQTAPEGTSLRSTIFKNKDQEAKIIDDKSSAKSKANKTNGNVTRQAIFTDYKPGGTTAKRSVARKAAVTQARPLTSDKPAEKKRDSTVTRPVIPDQGGVTPKAIGINPKSKN